MEPEITTPEASTETASAPESTSDRAALTPAYSLPSATDKPTPEPEPEQKPQVAPERVRNNTNAQRRINRTNEKLRSEIERLRSENEKLKNSQEPSDAVRADINSMQIDTYSNIVNGADQDEYETAAYEQLGDYAPEFLKRSYAVANYVNNNEPELRSYMGRPYGLILLNEWLKLMDKPHVREQWNIATSYEKGQVLNKYYRQMLQIANTPQKPKVQQKSVPAVAGGRNSTSAVATDDFGIALQQAFNRFGKR